MPADSLEGQNLGKYRVLEPLGRGGMARVYRAYHAHLDRYVAIKVLRSDLVDDEEFLGRFKREARAVASLRHPNIVQVYDFDTRDDIYYMVMELLEGDTLGTCLDEYRARNERMPWGEMVRVLLDVLDGLAYAHTEGMIHRDVKPANILLSRRGEAVLTDFGIAQIVGGTRYTVSGALMGTLSYMAPEQGLEGQCDARSDLYSLGIVLYEMLIGEPPFDAETPLAILLKHVNDPLPLPRQKDPAIPVPLERVVLKALAKRPQDRYQTAEEMAQALRSAAEQAGIKVPARIRTERSEGVPLPASDQPPEPIAVLSGSARAKITPAGFAPTADTDPSLGHRLAEERAAVAQDQAANLGVVIQGRLERSRPPAKPKPEAPQAPAAPEAPEPSEAPTAGKGGPSGVLGAVWMLIVFNLLAILIGLVTGSWGIYERGWPVELLLVGLLLNEAMASSGWVWLIVPGLVLANGYLFSFYALTGAWGLWSILWPLEPLMVVGALGVFLHQSSKGEPGAHMSRRLAQAVKRPTAITIIVVSILAIILGLVLV